MMKPLEKYKEHSMYIGVCVLGGGGEGEGEEELGWGEDLGG